MDKLSGGERACLEIGRWRNTDSVLTYQSQGHEMQNYGAQQQQQQQQQQAPAAAPHVLSQQDFLGRIGHLRNEIGTVTRNIEAIASLHQRSLAESDNGLSSQQLERIVAETQNLNAAIRDQLKFLANDANKDTGSARSLKERQVNTIKNEFERELHSYQSEESAFRQRYRDQIARQYRIVNPEASEDEVRQAAEADWGNEGVFQTAVRFRIPISSLLSIFLFDCTSADLYLLPAYSSALTAPAKPPPSSAMCARATTSCSASSRP